MTAFRAKSQSCRNTSFVTHQSAAGGAGQRSFLHKILSASADPRPSSVMGTSLGATSYSRLSDSEDLPRGLNHNNPCTSLFFFLWQDDYPSWLFYGGRRTLVLFSRATTETRDVLSKPLGPLGSLKHRLPQPHLEEANYRFPRATATWAGSLLWEIAS